MTNLGPNAEPVAWANAAALIVASLLEYGVPISDSLGKLLVLGLPFALANLWARSKVFAPDTVDQLIKDVAAAVVDAEAGDG